MILNKEIVRFCRKYHRDIESYKITDDYFFFMYPYSLFIKDKVEKIVNKYSPNLLFDKANFIDDITFQIVAFAKPKIFNYIILYEYQISVKEDILNGETDEEKLSWFITKISNEEIWINYCFKKYPIFLELLENFTKSVLNYLKDVLNNFGNDSTEFNQLNVSERSLLKKITLFVGDLHCKGKSVVFFDFDDGSRLVYKPRSANNEIALLDFYGYIRKEGLNLKIGIPKFLNKIQHTWYEYIKESEIESIYDLPSYYQNLGKLLCLFFILGTNDIIPDNIVSSKGIPYFVDLESLLTKPKSHKINPEINSHFEAGVINVGILPVWMISSINERNKISSVLFPYEQGNGKISKKHLPFCKNEYHQLSPVLVPHFINGFKEAYNFFSNNKNKISRGISEIKSFETTSNRMVINPTSFYELLFNELVLPESLHGDISLRELLESIILSDTYKELGDPEVLLESIINQLLYCDIPFFYVKKDGIELYDGLDKVVLSNFNFNNKIGIQTISEKLMMLSNEDLVMQLTIINSTIKIAFDKFKVKHVKEKDLIDFKTNKLLSYDFLKTAEIIGNNIYNSKILIGDEINWVGKNRNLKDGIYETMPMNQSLYDGNIGIALFYNYLYKYTGKNKYRDISIKLFSQNKEIFYLLKELNYFQTLPTQFKEHFNLTAFGYPVNLIYLMNHFPSVFFDRKLERDIFNEIDNFIPYTENFDFFSGLSGLIDVLLGEKNIAVNKKYQKILDHSVNTLIKKSIERKDQVFWIFKDPFDNYRKMELGGFAHGSAGIAYVLNKLFEKVKNDKYLNIAYSVLTHDRSFFVKSINGWRDGRSIDHVYDGGTWCHGSGGIALSRLLLMNSGLKDELFNDEVMIAASKLKKTIGGNQCICHGDMGNLEMLYAIGKYFEDKSILKIVDQKLKIISDQINIGKKIKCGDDSIEQLMGLFTGITGIGYQFLRFLDWENVPSLLCLEHCNNLHSILH